MKRTVTCNHPELRPTQWEQKKPEPYVGETCECGRNFSCPVCGYGFGCYPCECPPNPAINYKIESIKGELNAIHSS